MRLASFVEECPSLVSLSADPTLGEFALVLPPSVGHRAADVRRETAGMERVLAYRKVKAILIYDRRIGIVNFLVTDETVGLSEGIYFNRR